MGAKVFFENGKGPKRKLSINGEDLGEFKGIPQRDLKKGDRFEELEIDEKGVQKIVTREIIDQQEIEGTLIVRSVIVNG